MGSGNDSTINAVGFIILRRCSFCPRLWEMEVRCVVRDAMDGSCVARLCSGGKGGTGSAYNIIYLTGEIKVERLGMRTRDGCMGRE